ncbi:MAG: arylsulfatase [Planctomycetota bacterium]|jgi:arylsulfatase
MLRSAKLSAAAVTALLAACASTGSEAGGSRSAGAAPSRPNVVLVFVDDLGAGELGCYGQEHIRTPHIDSIAARGVRFTQGYTGSPVCAPSRCVLLTGKHSGHAEVRANWENGGWGPDEPEGQWPLPDGEVTLAERLGAAGYRTAGYGKWGLGGPGTEGAPERQGFDHFYGYLCQRVAHNYYPTHLWMDGERAPIEGAGYFKAHQKLEAPLEDADAYYRRFGDGEASYAPKLIADDMIEWLEDAAGDDEPFFLYYASIIPHLALQVPREYVERYPAAWDDEPYLGQNAYLPHPSPRRAYAGMISFLDDQVGRILDTLEDRGVAENTIVLFTSDNGATYVGGVDTEFFESHDGRRGHKGQLYEGGVRVPFLASWPGHFPEGHVSDRLVSTVDVTATVLDLAGLAPAADPHVAGDSVSFAAAAQGAPPGSLAARPYLYWEYRPAGAQAVRRGKWKLVRTGLKKGAPRLELYDLDLDPRESTDVAASFPDVVTQLAALMDASHEPSEGFPLPTVDGDAAEIMRRRTRP